MSAQLATVSAIPFIRHVPGESPADRVVDALSDGAEASLFELRMMTGLHAVQADNAVGQLVRQRRVRRVHCADGVMRYRLVKVPMRASQVTPLFVAGTSNRIDADVMGVLTIEGGRMPLGAIAARLATRYDEATVKRSLSRLKAKNFARSEGRNNKARWSAVPAHERPTPSQATANGG